ncbi:MAG: ankyrin repeat domain-containing protein, partial [Bacteroidota bacterium]
MPRIISLIVWSLLYVSTLPAQNPFRTACDGNLARLDSLLTADNSLLYQSDQRQRSLLHWAVACEQRAVVDYLLAKGSDLDAEDDQGKTPMHMAVRFGRSTYFELLRQAQPNPSWTKRYGVSLLQEAIFQRDTTFLAMLVAEGVNVNGTNERGTTPLELSQRLGEPVLVDFLLRHGADPDRVRSFSAAGPYFGQAPPDTTPVVFAPNFISTEEYEFGSVFNAAG